MDERAASPSRQVLGRSARQKRTFWLVLLVLFGLFAIAWIVFAVVLAVAVRNPIVALMFSPFALPWVYAFAHVRRMPGTVAFDSAGVEVRTLLRTWRYPWGDIAAVRSGLVPSFWRPPMRFVQALKLTKSVNGRSALARLQERMTGGAGMLPGLDFDEMDTLREALARYGSVGHEEGPSTDGGWVMKMIISRCGALGDISDVTQIGTLASIDLVNHETTGAKVRESIQSGHWAAASGVRQGTPGSDWVDWYVIERGNGQGAVLEVVSYFELWANDECDLVRTLTRYDLDTVRSHVTDWVALVEPGEHC